MLSILYIDDQLIAIDKPVGMLVHRSKIDAGEKVFALQTLRDQIGERVYPVHRLDKPTSGVLLFARNSEIASIVASDFAGHKIKKKYMAIVRGWTPDVDTIDYPLKPIFDRTTDRQRANNKPAQEAQTEFLTLSTCELPFPVGRYASARYSLVEIRPKTGRKNQIRRHFKHIFHPIVGDRKFGDGAHNRFFKENFHVDRMLLSATGLELRHPTTSKVLKIECEHGFSASMMGNLGFG